MWPRGCRRRTFRISIASAGPPHPPAAPTSPPPAAPQNQHATPKGVRALEQALGPPSRPPDRKTPAQQPPAPPACRQRHDRPAGLADRHAAARSGAGPRTRAGHNQTPPPPTSASLRRPSFCPTQRRPGGVRPPALPRDEPHRREPRPTCGVVVREISAHCHHKHLTRHSTVAFTQVRTVELRGLEPLTLDCQESERRRPAPLPATTVTRAHLIGLRRPHHTP